MFQTFLIFLIYSINIVIAKTSEVAVETFIYKEAPFAFYQYPKFKNWNNTVYSKTTLRYEPTESILAHFEVPPSIVILKVTPAQESKIKFLDDKGVNSFGVSYRQIYISGFERQGYFFQKDNQSLIVMSLENLPQHGLMGDKAQALLKDSFHFFDLAQPSPIDILILLKTSPLLGDKNISAESLVIERLESFWVVTINSPEKQKFRISSQNLEVMK